MHGPSFKRPSLFMKKTFCLLLQIFFALPATSQHIRLPVIQGNCQTVFPEFRSFEFNSFVFHPLDFSCERGFRISFEEGCWKNSAINDTPCIFPKHHVKILVILHEKYARCFFPLALTLRPGYVAKDSAFLTLERSFVLNWKRGKIIFIPGDYPVKPGAGSLIIDLPIQEETVIVESLPAL